MNLYKLLCSDSFRHGLEEYIDTNAPELLECDPNKNMHNCIKIVEFNGKNGIKCDSWFGYKNTLKFGPIHHFSLILSNKENTFSHQCLWTIYEETPLDDIYKVSKDYCWGYLWNNGCKYPNIGAKVKNLIIEYSRKEKLKQLQKWEA